MRLAALRGVTRSRIPLVALIALAAGVAGCTGDKGSTGAPGATGPASTVPGPTGPAGATGATGASGASAPLTIEQGAAVVIGDGSTLTADQIKSIGSLVATINSVSIPSTGTVVHPAMTFTVKTAHGGPALGIAPSTVGFTIAKLIAATGGFPSQWQSYVNVNPTSKGPNALPSAIQATTENGATGTFTEIGNGQYSYTYKVDLKAVTTPLAVSFQPSLTHREGFEIRLGGSAEPLGPDNPVKDIVPDGSAGSGNKLIAATVNCVACHERLDLHGGPRHTVEYCVTCHNPATTDPESGESVDMAYLAHSIHSGALRGSPISATSASQVTTAIPYIIYGFGGSANNFGTVTYPQSRLFCESCHTKSATAPDGDAWMVNSTASSCGGCHIGNGTTTSLNKTYNASTGTYTYTYSHTSFPPPGFTPADGTCVQCHVTGGAAGGTLANHDIKARLQTEQGKNFVFSVVKVTNAGLGKTPSVQFLITKADGKTPIDINTDPAFAAPYTGTPSASLDFYLGWDTSDISNAITTPACPAAPAPPTSACYGGLPATSTFQGYRMRIWDVKAQAVKQTDGSYITPFYQSASVSTTAGVPVLMPVPSTNLMVSMGGHPVAAGVNATPVSAVGYSGTPRVTLVSMANCNKCHVELQLHGGGRNGNPQMCLVCHNSSGNATSIPGPIDFGAFVHNIHASNTTAVGAVTYPQSLENCQACHLPNTYYTARTGALPMSTALGAVAANVTDDTWNSATAGTCGTCHDAAPQIAHMTQNGGQFGVVGGKQLIPSSATETCSICHGQDRIADTVKAHAGTL